jgi:hypothetical protein
MARRPIGSAVEVGVINKKMMDQSPTSACTLVSKTSFRRTREKSASVQKNAWILNDALGKHEIRWCGTLTGDANPSLSATLKMAERAP